MLRVSPMLSLLLSLCALQIAALPALDEPLHSGVRAPNDRAVVIDVGRHARLGVEVPYAEAAGETMAAVLVHTVGIPARRVTSLSSPDALRTRRAVERAGQRTGPGGTVWLFFCGFATATRGADDWVLWTADPDLDAGGGAAPAGVALSELTALAAAGGAEVTAIVDLQPPLAARRDDPTSQVGGLSAFAAATASPHVRIWVGRAPATEQAAWPGLGARSFSYLAAGAMRGWADGALDGARDGRVELDEAAAFVADRWARLGVAGASAVRGRSTMLTAGRALERDPGEGAMVAELGVTELPDTGPSEVAPPTPDDALAEVVADAPRDAESPADVEPPAADVEPPAADVEAPVADLDASEESDAEIVATEPPAEAERPRMVFGEELVEGERPRFVFDLDDALDIGGESDGIVVVEEPSTADESPSADVVGHADAPRTTDPPRAAGEPDGFAIDWRVPDDWGGSPGAPARVEVRLVQVSDEIIVFAAAPDDAAADGDDPGDEAAAAVATPDRRADVPAPALDGPDPAPRATAEPDDDGVAASPDPLPVSAPFAGDGRLLAVTDEFVFEVEADAYRFEAEALERPDDVVRHGDHRRDGAPRPTRGETAPPNERLAGRGALERYGYSFARVEAGEFWMGSGDDDGQRALDEYQRKVVIERPFEIGVTEVTQQLWEAVMGENPSASRERSWYGQPDGRCSDYAGTSLVGDDLPVHCIDFYDVIRFCNRLSELEGRTPVYWISGTTVGWNRGADGYRLPTEAEWEYAARAGTAQRFAGTDAPEEICRYANVKDEGAAAHFGWSEGHFRCFEGYAGLAPVGSFEANAWGLQDMSGNVWEWVWDRYEESSFGRASTIVAMSMARERVYRGGSWVNVPSAVRAAYRAYGPPTERGDVGLRLARSVDVPGPPSEAPAVAAGLAAGDRADDGAGAADAAIPPADGATDAAGEPPAGPPADEPATRGTQALR